MTIMGCSPRKGTYVVDESFGHYDYATAWKDVGMREEWWAYAECTECPAQVPVHVFGSMEEAERIAGERWNARV